MNHNNERVIIELQITLVLNFFFSLSRNGSNVYFSVQFHEWDLNKAFLLLLLGSSNLN